MSNPQDELTDHFNKWDPMKEDYLNSDFNLYDYGPGAGLDPALQPAELAKGKTTKIQPYLVFKNLPKNMTEKSLKLLCERYGTVQKIYENRKSPAPSIFVYFHNISDMDAVHRALKETNFGFEVSIGRDIGQQNKKDIDSEIGKSWSIPNSLRSPSDINIEDRNIIISGRKPLRPKLSNSIPNEHEKLKGSDSAISQSDPLQHCVKQTDSHELERAGIKTTDQTPNTDEEFQYSTGRVYYKMPEKTKSYVEVKHQKSIGIYNTDLEKYLKENSLKKKPNIMRCVVCNTVADISCYRCGPDFYIYCGKGCQNIDWENHRQICGKPKDLKNTSTQASEACAVVTKSPEATFQKNLNQKSTASTSSSASSSASPNNVSTKSFFPIPQMPPSNSVVVLTAVNSPNMVFIRSRENKENAKFFEIVSKLQASSKRLQPLKTLPHEGQAVIAKFEKNGEFGRALVLKVQDLNNIRINFLDYGNVEIVKLSQLYKIPREFMLLPRFAVPVILKDVPKCYMTNEVRSFLYTYLRDIDLIIKYSNERENLTAENIYQVDLYDASTNQHLNKTIATICQPHEPRDSDEIVTIENLKRMPLPVGNDIELVILDNSEIQVGCISCTTEVYHREIEGFQKDVQNYANSLQPQCYAPREDELCVAKYSADNLWYRGRCMNKVGDGKPSILFIDFGNFDYVPVKNIRPYPPEFSWPIFTADFGIAGLPEEDFSGELVKKLEELFPVGKVLKADKVEHIDGNFYILHMESILKTLADEELLTQK